MQTWSSYTKAQCVWRAAGAQNTLLFFLSSFVHRAHCLDTNFPPSHSGCERTALPTFLQEAERIRRNLPKQPWVCAAGWSKLLNQAAHEGWTGRLVTELRTSTKTDAWDKILQKCKCDSSKSLGRLCVSCEQQPARRWPSWGQLASPHGSPPVPSTSTPLLAPCAAAWSEPAELVAGTRILLSEQQTTSKGWEARSSFKNW